MYKKNTDLFLLYTYMYMRIVLTHLSPEQDGGQRVQEHFLNGNIWISDIFNWIIPFGLSQHWFR